MSIVTGSYTVNASQPGFINVEYQSIGETRFGPAPLKGSVWFERANLRWIVESLRECLTGPDYPAFSTQVGDDRLKVYQSGPEPAPYFNLSNERPDSTAHGGYGCVFPTRRLAEELLDELHKLLGVPAGGEPW